MNRTWQIAAALIVVLIIVILYWTRFQTIPVNYAYAPAFYKINRLTGETTLTVGKEFVPVKEADEKALRPPVEPPAAPGPAPKSK